MLYSTRVGVTTLDLAISLCFPAYCFSSTEVL